MYEIKKDGARLALLDSLVYVLKNRNNIYIPCEPIKAEGVVIGNDYVEPIEGLEIRYLDGAHKIDEMNTAGAEAMQTAVLSLDTEPPVSAGVFTYPEWQPDTWYELHTLLTYEGIAYFTRQAFTSSAVYPPNAQGVESLYGVRPAPDSEGVYSYVYNMRVEVGMRVRSEKDGNVYVAIQNADPLTADPVDAVSIFVLT